MGEKVITLVELEQLYAKFYTEAQREIPALDSHWEAIQLFAGLAGIAAAYDKCELKVLFVNFVLGVFSEVLNETAKELASREALADADNFLERALKGKGK